jgi:hypothetical protein
MKRAFAIAVCFSVLYAGVVWALNGCESLASPLSGHSHGDSSVGHQHDSDKSHHPVDADPGKIHCPNLFGEFLVGSRISIDPNSRVSVSVGYESFRCSPLVHGLGACRCDLGPPGPIVSAHYSRHLLLSVIRI